jgi:hypothetical protein
MRHRLSSDGGDSVGGTLGVSNLGIDIIHREQGRNNTGQHGILNIVSETELLDPNLSTALFGRYSLFLLLFRFLF